MERGIDGAAMPRDLHERFAVWLEQKAGDRLGEYGEIVAYHLEHAHGFSTDLGPTTEKDADRARHAAALLADAARRASTRGDVRAQTNLLERALALLPSDEETRLELLLELGTVIGPLGDYARPADAERGCGRCRRARQPAS